MNAERQKQVRALALVLAVAIGAGIGWVLWWQLVLTLRESTDNAYVSGHRLVVAPQVTGTLIAVHSDDTQHVKAGQLLAELDPADALVALDAARATLAQAVRDVRKLQGISAEDRALVQSRTLELEEARRDYQRRKPLVDQRALAPEQLAHSADRLALAQLALLSAQKQAEASAAMSAAAGIADHPTVRAARSALVNAALGLQRTRILAPCSGDVVQRTAQPGQLVQAGTPLMYVVDTTSLWIDANFKEAQLRNLRIGQPVEAEVDLYGGAVSYPGRIAGFSAATGAAFALLPPQNAAGNWVKVVQRVPVRIALEPSAMSGHPLLLGLSAQVTVDTSDRQGARLAPAAVAAASASTPEGLLQAQAEADRIIAANIGEVP